MSTAQEAWLTGCPSCGMNSCDCDEGTWNPPAQRTPEETLDWLADQHRSQCGEDRPIQEWIRKMKEMLP